MQFINSLYGKFAEHKNDPLFKNSYYLIGNTFITAAVGFIFWIIAARLYSSEEIGISSAVISAMSLISIFSLLGLDISVIRYLPEHKDEKNIINTSFTITIVSTVLLSVLFLAVLDIFAPDISLLKENILLALVFILFTTCFSLFTLQLSVFIGFRTAKYSFIQSFINFIKLALLPLLVALGAFGIFVSFGFFYLVAFLAGNLFIGIFLQGYKFIPSINMDALKKMISYSFENYIANIFYSLPHFLLPLVVLNILGPVMNAYFYIAWTFSSILLTVPFAVSRSLLAEGSTLPGEVKQNIFKSFKFTFAILGILMVLILVFGKYILYLFGVTYADNAFGILILLSLASFPFAIVQLFTSSKRIKKDTKPVILVNMGVAIITLVLGYLIMHYVGLIGVGYAWLFANLFLALLIVLNYTKTHFK